MPHHPPNCSPADTPTTRTTWTALATSFGRTTAVTAAVAAAVVGTAGFTGTAPAHRAAPDPGPVTVATVPAAFAVPEQTIVAPHALAGAATAMATEVRRPFGKSHLRGGARRAGGGAARAARRAVTAAHPAPAAAPSSAGSVALVAAKSAIGTPYSWGGTGGRGFDCSGLMLWSFKKAGVSLPRTSRAQSTVGKPVAKSDLRPGDLVFFYNASHVGIYVGDGKVLNAPHTGDVVRISSMAGMPFHNARRL